MANLNINSDQHFFVIAAVVVVVVVVGWSVNEPTSSTVCGVLKLLA